VAITEQAGSIIWMQLCENSLHVYLGNIPRDAKLAGHQHVGAANAVLLLKCTRDTVANQQMIKLRRR
jgi:hypothetical protein